LCFARLSADIFYWVLIYHTKIFSEKMGMDLDPGTESTQLCPIKMLPSHASGLESGQRNREPASDKALWDWRINGHP
jgi:hypothetical protein